MNSPDQWSLKAGSQTLRLVSGFSPKARNARWLMFLQAYLDDSGMGQPPVSVMAGFVAPAEKWAAFSNEWQQILDMRPSIAYLKMSEAEACTGEFAHWSAERRDERVALFFSVIEKYASFAIASAVPHDMYQKIFQGCVSKEFQYLEYPYFLLFFGIVTSIAQHLVTVGRKEPIDFIFDSQPDQMKRVLNAWDQLGILGDVRIKPLVTNPPIFRDDKLVVALQAADLHAWWVRRMCDSHLTGRPGRPAPFAGRKTALAIPMLEMFWTKAALKRMRKSFSAPFVSEKINITGQFTPILRA